MGNFTRDTQPFVAGAQNGSAGDRVDVPLNADDWYTWGRYAHDEARAKGRGDEGDLSRSPIYRRTSPPPLGRQGQLFDPTSIPEAHPGMLSLSEWEKRDDVYWHASRKNPGNPTSDDEFGRRGYLNNERLHVGTFDAAARRYVEQQDRIPSATISPLRVTAPPKTWALDGGSDIWDLDLDQNDLPSVYENDVEDSGSVSAVVHGPSQVRTFAADIRDAMDKGHDVGPVREYIAEHGDGVSSGSLSPAQFGFPAYAPSPRSQWVFTAPKLPLRKGSISSDSDWDRASVPPTPSGVPPHIPRPPQTLSGDIPEGYPRDRRLDP